VLAVTARDRAAAAAVLPDDGRPLVALHLGASDPRRRWPVTRFAAVADDLAARGARLVVVGSGADDARAARALVAAARGAGRRPGRRAEPAGAGRTARRCSLVVANDSGPRHLAGAVGAPTVGVFLAPNALSAGPLTARRSRIAVSYRTRCPVCEQDQRSSRCSHDASLVADVEVDEVLELARELFDAEVSRARGRDGRSRRPRRGSTPAHGGRTPGQQAQRDRSGARAGWDDGGPAAAGSRCCSPASASEPSSTASSSTRSCSGTTSSWRGCRDDLAGLEANTLWDGVFHLVSWLVVVAGLVWTVRDRAALRPVPWPSLTGALLIGWGAFNITDQVVFHLLLEAHHIRMVEDYQLYDWGYTAIGALLVAGGWRSSAAPDDGRGRGSRHGRGRGGGHVPQGDGGPCRGGCTSRSATDPGAHHAGPRPHRFARRRPRDGPHARRPAPRRPRRLRLRHRHRGRRELLTALGLIDELGGRSSLAS
jgi:uncharacterized membrane protein